MGIPHKIAVLTLAASLAAAGTASAHVTVLPAETKQGAYEVFTVRVPTEKEAATVKLEVRFPEGITVSRVQPVPGWTYAFAANGDGSYTGITWTAVDGGLKEGEFGEFRLQGQVDEDAGSSLAWKAYQTYADGSVVEWVGGAGTDEPAPVTKVLAADGTGSGDHHAASPAGKEAEDADRAGWLSSQSVRSPSFYVALLALAAGLVAVSVSLRRGKRTV
jgi:uncharacterized protein YcnI